MENKIIKDIENTEINEIESIEQIEPQKHIYIYNYGIEAKEYLFKEIASHFLFNKTRLEDMQPAERKLTFMRLVYFRFFHILNTF